MNSHWPRYNPYMMAAVLTMMGLPAEEYRKTDTPEEATKRQRLAEERRRLADESARVRLKRKEAADAAYRALADKYREERLERKRIAMEKRKPRKEKK